MTATTIKISKELKLEFDKLKLHPRETYEQMIKRAINGELYPEKKDVQLKGGADNGTTNTNNQLA